MSDESATKTFLVPDLGEGLEEATVLQWLADVGQHVELNQPLVLVETAKAEVEVPSPYAGVVAEHGGAAGETLQVGTVLARIAVASAGEPAPAATELSPSVAPPRQPTLVGYGADASADKSRRTGSAAPARAVAAGSLRARGTKPLAKPPVRKLALDLGVRLSTVRATGRDGIVTRADVEAAVQGTHPRSSSDPAAGAQASYRVTVDCRRLVQLCDSARTSARRRGEAADLSPLAVIARGFVLAARRDGAAAVRLLLRTPTQAGVVTTVVERAEQHSAVAIGAAVADEATGSVPPPGDSDDALTIAVTDFGALGIDEGTPGGGDVSVGIGAIEVRPHVVNGELVATPTATITLACGRPQADDGARLLAAVVALIAEPELAVLAV